MESATRRAPTREFFGHAGLIQLITENQHATADGIADRILEEVDRFSGGKHPADDRTVLVLKVVLKLRSCRKPSLRWLLTFHPIAICFAALRNMFSAATARKRLGSGTCVMATRSRDSSLNPTWPSRVR